MTDKIFTEEELRAMSLGDRMKMYESRSRTVLDKREPAVIRIDGKAFHTYTKGFVKPFDDTLVAAMEYTMIKLCEEIQNVRIGYAQSDEISLLMTTHEHDNKQPWFGGKVSKIVSVAASTASVHFNDYMDKMYWTPKLLAAEIVGDVPRRKLATFDARVFNLPLDEVNNCFIWRQQDAIRNSISAMAQAEFSPSQLHKKDMDAMKQMLRENGKFWGKLPAHLQRGYCAVLESYEKEGTKRSRWVSDRSIPEFVQDREYVGKFAQQISI